MKLARSLKLWDVRIDNYNFSMVMSVIPASGVTNILVYEIKVIEGFILFIGVGAGIYWWGKKKNQ